MWFFGSFNCDVVAAFRLDPETRIKTSRHAFSLFRFFLWWFWVAWPHGGKNSHQRTYVSLALKSASLCKRSQFLSQWFQQKCWVKSQDHRESITASKKRIIWPSRFMWPSRFRKPWGAPLNLKNSERKENGFTKRIQADKTTATKNTHPDHIYI